ncbi:hypothetical protein AMJ49_01435 [Parcubacteria bacterium DG_74_2]|nr:MAG: hypothetical protein AMJ49_01435 [Parcubacteria bacterium DG_74_2]
MEKKWQEMIKKADNDELVRIIEKGKKLGKEAAKELLLRKDLSGKHLTMILNELSCRFEKEEIIKIKEETALKIIEKNLLDEEALLAILAEIESQKLLKKAVKKYRTENKKLSDRVLTKIIRKIPTLIEEVGWILLEQTTDTDALLVIEEEAQEPLQFAASKKHRETGRSLDDACWLIGFTPDLAEPIWQELQEDGKIAGLSLEQLDEIIQCTDSLEIKKEAVKEALKKTEEKRKRIIEDIKINPRDIKMLREFTKLNELIEDLKEVERELISLKP